jgi:hypothetical protein
MAHQNPFGGAPRIGNDAAGEPETPGGVTGVFGGAPGLINQPVNRGNDQLNSIRNGTYPEVYGKGQQLGYRIKGSFNTGGGGANNGAGDTSSTTTP